MIVPPLMLDYFRNRHSPPTHPAPSLCPMFPFSGKVLSIPDGDGLLLSVSGTPVKVRLYGCDAPEWGQPYARQSWLRLSTCVGTQPVLCYPMAADKYGRIVCDCYGLNKCSISLLLVLHGFAWYYRDYAPQAQELRDAQRMARFYRRGLWRESNPVPPWIFRHSGKRGAVKHVV